MGPPSSGGSTVGEALNILENVDLTGSSAVERAGALHHYLEASALAFADRGRYLGAPRSMQPGVLRQLLSQKFADERFCRVNPNLAASKPVAPGDADGSYDRDCDGTDDSTVPAAADTEGMSTTHLTTADRWGNVVSYTLTIEQTGGSAITVPNRGFLLNNELTDFSLDPAPGDPNAPGGGKRPRSSMSPTIVLDGKRPVLALGSPGGSTIITTVLQVLVNHLDFGMALPRAVAEPRATQRNTSSVQAEPAFDRTLLTAYGHTFSDPPGGELGAVAAIRFRKNGQLVAVAEPSRRGGGDAAVVRPRRR
jgi:gamma-glutamyltranspeptidase/glutathione hydrolase